MNWNPQEGSHENGKVDTAFRRFEILPLACLSSPPRLSDPTLSSDNQAIPY